MGILEKISSYNIFTNLLPGIIMGYLIEKLLGYNIFVQDILKNIIISYYIGIIINRIGSLIVEPILKKIKIIRFSKYEDYLKASKKDSKIDILIEMNNMYRSLVSTNLIYFLIVILCKGLKIDILNLKWSIIYSIATIFLFAYSYRKQTKYIVQRIEINKD